MPPWATSLQASVYTSVKWGWWAYPQGCCEGHMKYLPWPCFWHLAGAPYKDLLYAHTWVAPCFEGGQRWNPVLRQLTVPLEDNNYPAWNTQETIQGSGRCRTYLSFSLSAAPAWSCLGMGRRGLGPLTAVWSEPFLPLRAHELLACFLFWLDTLMAIFESWTLSAEEGGILSAGDRCRHRLHWVDTSF